MWLTPSGRAGAHLSGKATLLPHLPACIKGTAGVACACTPCRHACGVDNCAGLMLTLRNCCMSVQTWRVSLHVQPCGPSPPSFPSPLDSRLHDPIITQVEERVANWLKIPVSHQEDTQVLRWARAVGCTSTTGAGSQGAAVPSSTCPGLDTKMGAPAVQVCCQPKIWRSLGQQRRRKVAADRDGDHVPERRGGGGRDGVHAGQLVAPPVPGGQAGALHALR